MRTFVVDDKLIECSEEESTSGLNEIGCDLEN